MSVELQKTIQSYENYISVHGISEEVIDAYCQAAQTAIIGEKDTEYGLKVSARAKELIEQFVLKLTGGTMDDLELFCAEKDTEYKIVDDYYSVLQCEAAYLVDSFFRYIEVDEKDPYKRFYFPRRKVLQPVVSAYQEIYDGKLDFLSVSQPKRTGKTTGGLKLAEMMGGRDPDGSIFAVGKGEGLVKRFYGGLLQDFETERTYKRFLSVFPQATKIGERDYKSAENLSIDLKGKNIFPTFTCRPIDGAIVGCTEANVLVYIDDCVKNHEEARNRDRLTTETKNNNSTVETVKEENKTPTVEELMAQLASERAEKEKNKLALDKALKEKGDITKQLRAKQTAEEQEAEAQKEAQRLADEERETLRKENNRFKAMAAYKNLDEKTVDKLLEAVSDADHATLAAIIEGVLFFLVVGFVLSTTSSSQTISGKFLTLTGKQYLAVGLFRLIC